MTQAIQLARNARLASPRLCIDGDDLVSQGLERPHSHQAGALFGQDSACVLNKSG